MRKKISSASVIIIVLLLANIYQIFRNSTTNKNTKIVTNNELSESSILTYNRHFYLEEFIFQNYRLDSNFVLIDKFSEIISNDSVLYKNGLILYFTDINCTDCNVNRINNIVDILSKLEFKDLLVITNYESHRDFLQMIRETKLEEFRVYNSDLMIKKMESGSVLMFLVEDGVIKYPISVTDAESSFLSQYITFIKQLSISN